VSAPNRGPGDLSLPFLEGLYEDYVRDPASVGSSLRPYFETLARDDPFTERPRRGPSFRRRLPSSARDGATGAAGDVVDPSVRQDRVDQLVRAYRVRGHLAAEVDPLGLRRAEVPELALGFHGLSTADLDRPFSATTMRDGAKQTLRQILDRLRGTYCRTLGVQFMHIDDVRVRRWLEKRMESTQNHISLERSTQLRILRRLTDAVVLEEFVQKKYLGAKSFSLEGAETLLPLLDLLIEGAGERGVGEIVLAMSHRGRLNVLVNLMGKGPKEVFAEFEDRPPRLLEGRGDVMYHLGYAREWQTRGGRRIHLSLCFNPSHLEFVNPVALGRVRARQDRIDDRERHRGLAVLVHGDASFAGEGVVQETLNMSELSGFSVGGSVHVVVNNQLGFTTPPEQYASGVYATDVAKMLQVPILHVNGEDPEAAAQAVHLALEFRQTFHRDVVIDLLCYRRRGHNETDEPSFTQPLMYDRIRERPPVRDSYLKHLLDLGELSREHADELAEESRARLQKAFDVVHEDKTVALPSRLEGLRQGYCGGSEKDVADPETAVPEERLRFLLEALTRLPADFHPHPKIRKGLELRLKQARGERPLDWSAGEALTFATLATEGVRVRLSGQDSARGTFSHRHFALHDVEDDHVFCPLARLADDQAPVEVWNSPLAETGPMAFEYGYSLDCPEGLVLWEAQFGDFVNAAQVVVDQFLTSGEEKWCQMASPVLLLPHGFEGMGPEHSSARLERFLALAVEDNIQIACPTTAAQLFHLLRRQARRRWRKPLVVMTPKSLLRHPRAASRLDDLSTGRFRRILPDETVPERASRVLLCSGKVAFDLMKGRQERGLEDVAILRLEQLYPLAEDVVAEALEPYGQGADVVHVQEEPANMGAWPHLRRRFGRELPGGQAFRGVARHPSASPATGSAASHHREQEGLVEEALVG
jgi:2-oxoglutarate dehydrogenase E1 component